MKRQLKIAVLLGGRSDEHEVSLQTGSFIAKTLDRSRYAVKVIPVTKEGDWIISGNFENVIPEVDFSGKDASVEFFTRFIQQNNIVSYSGIDPVKADCDLYVLGLHGNYSEDGKIQGFLETIGKPYTGSGVLASALAMDKPLSNLVFANAGFHVPEFTVYKTMREFQEKGISFAWPVIVKPSDSGSSVGIVKANDQEQADGCAKSLFGKKQTVMVQECITGTEVSCGVVEKPSGGGKFEAMALPVTEIRPRSDFFDYRAKYQKGGSEEITPAEIDPAVYQKVQGLAVMAHKLIGCRGYSRTDFIIRDNIPWILEINTLPGMSGTSLIPQQAKSAGLDMKDLLDWLVERAMV